MKRHVMLLVFMVVVMGASGLVSADTAAAAWREKVDSDVIVSAENGDVVEFLIVMAEQADLSRAAQLTTKESKGKYVYGRLTDVAERTQRPVIALLADARAEYRPFQIINAIWVRGGLDVLQAAAEHSSVARIDSNPQVKFSESADISLDNRSPLAIEWGLGQVNVDQVWALGYTGQGAVVAGQDTGYDWDHPGLQNQYRGWDGVSADHNYSWHDAIHSGGGVCGADSAEPCDDHGHGTHTAGTMAGDDGGTNQVGMAPDAKWIGCRNMNVGIGTPATYIECFQWFLAPTDLNDFSPDPGKSPHAINNSWGCPPSEGCNSGNFADMELAVNNVRAAGIVVVASAGNAGSSCSTVQDPPAFFENSFTVGSTTSADVISSFSSRGPVTNYGTRMKPNISAPGSSIRSTRRYGGYTTMSGTSMAGPHVAGLVALLISANPALAGNVDLIEDIIEQTAIPLTTSQGCGGDGSSDVPNNVYGFGRINALAAVQMALTLLPTNTAMGTIEATGAQTPIILIFAMLICASISGALLLWRLRNLEAAVR